MKIIAGILCCSLILLACDPMRRIRMKNSTSDNAEVIWTLKEDSIHSSPLYMSNSREVVFSLTPDRPGNFISLSCGVGKWTPDDVEALVDDIESLQIKWKNGEIRIDSAEAIKSYLISRRKGADKAKITIQVKD